MLQKFEDVSEQQTARVAKPAALLPPAVATATSPPAAAPQHPRLPPAPTAEAAALHHRVLTATGQLGTPVR